jgi:glutamate racemase
MCEGQAAALTVKDILANVATVASNTSSKQVDLKAVIDVLKVAIVDLAKLVEKGGEEDSKKTENLKKQIKQQDDKIKTLDERLKQQYDEIDNQIQRNLK